MKSSFKTYLPDIKATLLLAWPVILGQLGHIVIGLVDSAMIGQLGPTELAASAFGNSLFYLTAVIGWGMCMGISPVVAQALGEKDNQKLANYMQMGLRVVALVAVAITIITLGISQVIPFMPHKNPEVLPLAKQYLSIVSFSIVPMLIFSSYRSYVEGFSWMIPGMVVTGIVVVLNVFLNWLLIFGNWGFPKMGLEGGAWATVTARTIGMFIMMFVVARSKRFMVFGPLKFWVKNHWESMKEILRIGLPTGFQLFFEVGSFSGALFMAGLIGKIDQSAHQIAIGLASVTYMVYSGFGSAVAIRVGGAYGRGDEHEVKKAGVAGMWLGGSAILFFFTMMILLRNLLPELFIKEGEEEVIQIASRLMVIAAFFQWGDGIQVVALGALRGVSDVRIPTMLTFIAYWGIGLPLGYVLAFPLGLGIDGLWYSLTAGLVFSAGVMTARFLRWEKRQAKEK